MKKSKLRSKTPKCLLEKNRYQAIVDADSQNRLVRRAAMAIERKVKKPFVTTNIIQNT